MWRLLRRLFDEHVLFTALSPARFETGYRDAMSNGELSSWLDRLVNVGVLFLDDPFKVPATDCMQSSLFSVVDERTSNGLPILTTMNDSSATLSARLSADRSEPLVRRLRDYCDTILFERPAAKP
jgi:DNA replication protein DnaC